MKYDHISGKNIPERNDVLNIFVNLIDDLDEQIGILENRHDSFDTAECSVELATSSR